MRDNRALLVIDMQVAMFEGNEPVYSGEKLLETVCNLIHKARNANEPVIYIQHNGKAGGLLEQGTRGWNIHKRIEPNAEDIVIQKNSPDSFLNTELQSYLENKGIKKLIITGIQSDVCVDTTCKRAYSKGYNLVLVKDGHSTWGTDELTAEQIISHENYVLGNWFAELKNADEIDF